nr:uncharacterized protein LOC126537762 isoform X2 [Dermacentor andersoni]
MAFSTFRFDEYSIAQIEEILEQRDRSGFHAYYEDGYDENKFVCIAPWYMSNGSMMTSVLRYPSKKTGELTDNSEISLGRYKRHRYDRIKILFEKNNAIIMEYVRDENSTDKVKLTDKNVIGSHVFRFVRGNDELTVFFDGKLVSFNNEKVRGPEIDDFVVLYTDESRPKFSMVETHYTMTDTTLIRTGPAYFNSVKNYFFSHQGVWLRMGGYALWNGKWKPGTKSLACNKLLTGHGQGAHHQWRRACQYQASCSAAFLPFLPKRENIRAKYSWTP